MHKYKWLKQNVQGIYPQSALLNTIVEFALKEEPVDVEKMRKCLLKQVKHGWFQVLGAFLHMGLTQVSCFICISVVVLQLERAEVRLEGIDTILKLATKSFLLPSVQYSMFCGWQRLIPEGTNIG